MTRARYDSVPCEHDGLAPLTLPVWIVAVVEWAVKLIRGTK
jgi:hypothetical protein